MHVKFMYMIDQKISLDQLRPINSLNISFVPIVVEIPIIFLLSEKL